MQGHKLNIPAMIFLFGVPLMAAILVPYSVTQYGFHWALWLYLAVHYSIDCFAITGGYHRLFSHRSYEAAPWLKAIFLFLGAGTFQNSALIWCIDHRKHHRFVDTDLDPYGINKGFFWAHMQWMFYSDQPDYSKKSPADLRKDKLIQIQHKFFAPLAIFVGLIVPGIFSYLVYGNFISGFAIGGLLRLFLSSHCTFFINSAAHTWGNKTYSHDHSAQDNWIMSLLTFGEGYHNFHHTFQADYRNGVKWYHWDPTKWGIYLFSIIGAAKNLRKTPEAKIVTAELKAKEIELSQKGYDTKLLSELKATIESIQIKISEMHKEYEVLRKNRSEKTKLAVFKLKKRIQNKQNEFLIAQMEWHEAIKKTLSTQIRI